MDIDEILINENGDTLNFYQYSQSASIAFQYHIGVEVKDIDTKKAGILFATSIQAFVDNLHIQNSLAIGITPNEKEIKLVEIWNSYCSQVLNKTYSWEDMKESADKVLTKLYPYSYKT